jgi:hypothetical protein
MACDSLAALERKPGTEGCDAVGGEFRLEWSEGQ